MFVNIWSYNFCSENYMDILFYYLKKPTMIPFRERSCNLGERKATAAWKTPACQEPAERPLLPQATSDVDSASEGQINVKMYPLSNDKIKNTKKNC